MEVVPARLLQLTRGLEWCQQNICAVLKLPEKHKVALVRPLPSQKRLGLQGNAGMLQNGSQRQAQRTTGLPSKQ